jgi:hypothetical protein
MSTLVPGTLYGGSGVDISGIKLKVKPSSVDNMITITNLSYVPAFNRLPDLFTIYVYRDAAQTPIFYDVSSTNIVTPISPSALYSVVYPINANAVTMGYSTNNGGSLYCGELNALSIPITDADTAIANMNGVQVLKLLFYYFNS